MQGSSLVRIQLVYVAGKLYLGRAKSTIKFGTGSVWIGSTVFGVTKADWSPRRWLDLIHVLGTSPGGEEDDPLKHTK